jgi:hypothetical protein
MRTKDGLRDLEKVTILHQYLYMGYPVSYKNAWDKEVKLYMAEDFQLYTITHSIAPSIKSPYSQGLEGLIAIIDQLENTNISKWGRTMTSWEYVNDITIANLTTNSL